MLLALAGCSAEHEHAKVSQEQSGLSKTQGEYRMATRGPTQTSGRRKLDWEAIYQSILKEEGVKDFSTESLMNLITDENESIRTYSILLLGERKVISAIPNIEEALNDESYYVKKAATRALLKMGNREGIKVLQKLCESYSKEVQDGNYKNLTHLSGATRVLADAGEVQVIPYLRQLANYHGDYSWSIRLGAMESLAKLYEKDASVLADIASMQNDEHPQVRKEAGEILERLEAEQQ